MKGMKLGTYNLLDQFAYSTFMLLELQWISMNVGFGIEGFTDESDIILLAETWEHDTQKIQGLGNYKCVITPFLMKKI